MTITLLVGFAAIGGILAGYVAGRLAPFRVLIALWGVSLLAAVAFFLWLGARGEADAIAGVAILYGGLIPFAGCAIVAGVIGLVARRTIAREPLD